MSNRTIAKFPGLVILVAALIAVAGSCSHASSGSQYTVDPNEFSGDYDKPVVVGRIESNEITESSGIASSLCQPNVLWTHNDSGDDAFIYAISTKGAHLGTFEVENARNDDWEDIASYKDPSGVCYLYIGDTGNNKKGASQQTIYRVKEPTVSPDASSSSRKSPIETEPASAAYFKYPEAVHDAETLMVRQANGDVYVLTKRVDGPSVVFKIGPQFGSDAAVVASKVGEVSLPAVPNGLMTGGAISPDGKRVILCDYSSAYELQLGASANFDDIWKQKPVPVNIGERKQGEAITFSPDGTSIFATSEKKNSPLIEVKRK
ncbi:MAG TPA: hypothetical protein VJV05_09855 [Pyrinomonadaceae bacterium]|nr:hypothetical protein [Pyrinomonadaceae bacterium]